MTNYAFNNYHRNTTGLWTYGEGDATAGDDYFAAREGDLFAVAEFNPHSGPYHIAPDQKSLIDTGFSSVLGADLKHVEFAVSTHRIRSNTAGLEYEHYLFYKLKNVNHPISIREHGNILYLHVLASEIESEETPPHKLGCLNVQTGLRLTSVGFDNEIQKFVDIVNNVNGLSAIAQLILERLDSVTILPQRAWICDPPIIDHNI